MYLCESQKYDMEFEVRKRDFEVLDWELTPFRKKTCSPHSNQCNTVVGAAFARIYHRPTFSLLLHKIPP